MEHDFPNLEQKLAIQHDYNKALLISAGPGSGKTSTLTYRVLEMMKSGINPKQICIFTLTNRAANQMRARLKELLSHDNLVMPTVTTFHSFCLRILKENKVLTEDVIIFTEEDQLKTMKQGRTKYKEEKSKKVTTANNKENEDSPKLFPIFYSSGSPKRPLIDLTNQQNQANNKNSKKQKQNKTQKKPNDATESFNSRFQSAAQVHHQEVNNLQQGAPPTAAIQKQTERSRLRTIYECINYAKSNGKASSDDLDPVLEEEERAVFEYYEKTKESYNAVDFNDMLNMGAKMLKDQPEILEDYNQR
jgi:superfamily I DNA/RNA helicase